MQFIELTLPSLGELDDGRVAAAFLHELKRAVQDCIDRPSDQNARTVSLELSLKPIVTDSQGVTECDGAWGEFSIKSKVPTRKSKPYPLQVNKRGQASFSANNPEHPDQSTIDDLDGNTGRVRRKDLE